MILDDFLIINERGLYCRYGEFYLDPNLPVNRAVISHAHGDHACKLNEHVYSTPATAAIIRHRYQKNAGKHFNEFSYLEPFELNGVKVSFYPAGHILGSAQVLMEYEGCRYLYTGDYKLQPDPTCEAIEFPWADVFITESTFADPDISHPDPVSEIRKFNAFSHNVLLGAYSLGKAQRLISLLNQYCPQRPVLVHHTILPLNRIYEQFGYSPGKYELYNRKLMKHADQNYVYIVPPLTFDSYFRAKNVVRAFASGWARRQHQNQVELLISDHVDWEDILKSIELVNPSEVWTTHGNGKFLRDFFKDRIHIKMLNHAG